MSTRANIEFLKVDIRDPQKLITVVRLYVGCDGYPDYVLPLLRKSYRSDPQSMAAVVVANDYNELVGCYENSLPRIVPVCETELEDWRYRVVFKDWEATFEYSRGGEDDWTVLNHDYKD